MRIVGNKKQNLEVLSPDELLSRGAKLDAMVKSLRIPDFQPQGVFRGTQAMFDEMDAERSKKIREWVNAHTRYK